MSKKENLIYDVIVKPDTEYRIKIRIGDGQDGDHNVFGNCPYEHEPVNDKPEWKTKLAKGSKIKDTVLYVSSATQDNNPNTNYVSVRVFINGEQITQLEGENKFEVDDNEIAYFNQKINFV